VVSLTAAKTAGRVEEWYWDGNCGRSQEQRKWAPSAGAVVALFTERKSRDSELIGAEEIARAISSQ